jgi:hypothetical protein
MTTQECRKAIVDHVRNNGPLDVEDLYEWMASKLKLSIHQGASDLRVLRNEGVLVRDQWCYRLGRAGDQAKLWG